MSTPLAILQTLASATPTTALTPRRFFVAWYGVLTLAFEGWPPAFLTLKQEIETQLPNLAPENPGSRWPHTTLGALHDARTLSFEELVELQRICARFDQLLATRGHQFTVDRLDYAEMTQRSLEVGSTMTTLPLDKDRYVASEVSDKHAAEVARIHAMFNADRLKTYWPDVAKPGHRAAHYRDPCNEKSLLFRWRTQQPAYVQDFIEAVEKALSGAYVWFTPESRHVTLRTVNDL